MSLKWFIILVVERNDTYKMTKKKFKINIWIFLFKIIKVKMLEKFIR